MLLLAAVAVCLFAPDRDSCVLTLCWFSFDSGILFFNQSQPWIGMKQTKTAARLTHTCDTCAHTHILDAYIMIQLQHYSSVATCSGYTNIIQYTAVRMHVYVCTYQVHSISYIATTNSNGSINSSATASSRVGCCLPCAICIRIYSGVLLLLGLNCVQ